MNLTQDQALKIVSLDSIRMELRIPDGAHDTLLSEQIHSAANFVSKSTGAELADLPALRPAIVAAVRRLYDGLHEVTPNAAHNAWMAPYRSFKPPE